MVELIFLISLCGIVWGFYSMISKYYISKQYILKEMGDNSKRMTKIRGNYIDIIYNEMQIHIEKKEDGKWYSQKSMETIQKMTETELKINEPFNIEDKSFMITEKEIKGGVSVLLPLITTVISVLSLFLQGSFIAISSTEENTSEEKHSTQMFGIQILLQIR